MTDLDLTEEERVTALHEEVAIVMFQSVEARRQFLDQMMWQVPALGLTAQAFLLAIALGDGSSWFARVAAAALGLVAALAGVQLLLKHRYHEMLTSFWLERFAKTRYWPVPHEPERAERFAFNDHTHPWKPDGAGSSDVSARLHKIRCELTVDRSSPYVWVGALLCFGVVDAVVLGTWVVHLFGGGDPF